MSQLVDIKEAVQGLKDGKTLLYPTDTVWGIGCDCTNEEAIQRIIEIKKRDAHKSFILLVDSVAMLERYVDNIPDVCYDLIDLATKPTTIIYDTPNGLPTSLLAEDGSIAIRVTDDNLCKRMIQQLRKPIVSTSANISKEPTARNYSEINSIIKEQVDFILNERLNEDMSTPSSIIKVGNDYKVKVIRS
ncbi:MAG: L-threonylcarbamoyladenylate synthase [Brumimicrobium sp.]|nr:L-threonylcarbamoyladenylate synthase [Brumimicrobium sp.]